MNAYYETRTNPFDVSSKTVPIEREKKKRRKKSSGACREPIKFKAIPRCIPDKFAEGSRSMGRLAFSGMLVAVREANGVPEFSQTMGQSRLGRTLVNAYRVKAAITTAE